VRSRKLHINALIIFLFSGTVFSFPLSNNDLTTELLHSIWRPWVTANIEATAAYTIEWDEENEVAGYIANNFSEWLIRNGYGQQKDNLKVITIITIRDAQLDFTIDKSKPDQYGDSRYQREIQVKFDMGTIEKISRMPLRNEHFERRTSDEFGDDDLTFILDDPFVVEPRVKFPVAGVSATKMILISTLSIVLAALLFFIRS